MNPDKEEGMKRSSDWDESDLLALVRSEGAETSELEFKGSEALDKGDSAKNEISKDVSSFGNSAGGTIVYGIVELGHAATRLDAGVDPNVISREWVDQVIHSRIRPRPVGVLIKQVNLAQTSPGRVAYVVEIPSTTRALQASDKKFYKRFNFQAVPMEVYEIDDVNRRGVGPDLRVRIQYTPDMRRIIEGQPPRFLAFSLLVENDSEHAAMHAIVDLFVDRRLRLVEDNGRLATNVAQAFGSGTRMLFMNHYRVFWGANLAFPLFKGAPLTVNGTPIVLEVPPGRYSMRWEVRAPSMVKRSRFAVFEATERSWKIVDEFTDEEFEANPNRLPEQASGA